MAFPLIPEQPDEMPMDAQFIPEPEILLHQDQEDDVDSLLILEEETTNLNSGTTKLPDDNRTWRYCTHWKWESLACLLTLFTPVIMFATLYPHKNQPLPEWPFGISINALFAIYTLVFRTAMSFVIASCLGQLQWVWFSAQPRSLYDMVRYDDATRGALGSLLLIVWHRLHEPLTALGAVVAVLAVGNDAFVQQIVQTTACSTAISTNTSAKIPRTNMYDVTLDENLMAPVQKLFKSAFQNAIYSPGQPPPWTCSTGNCTFAQPYTTLGICSSCTDVSEAVTISTTIGFCSRCMDPEDDTLEARVTCNYENNSTVYYNDSLDSTADCYDKSDFTVASTFLTDQTGTLTLNATLSPWGSVFTPAYLAVGTIPIIPESTGVLAATGSALPFSYMQVLGNSLSPDGTGDWVTVASSNSTGCGSDETGTRGGNWTCRGYGAANCLLYPCVQEYQADISAGVLNETMISQSSEISWGNLLYLETFINGSTEASPLALMSLDTQCLTQSQRTALAGRGYQLDQVARWIPFDLNVTDWAPIYNLSLPADIESLLEDGCLFMASAIFLMIQGFDNLSGMVEGNGPTPGTGSPNDMANSFYTLSNFTGPDALQSIYDWGDGDFDRLESVLANISNSWTTLIRTQGSPKYSTPVQGDINHYATCLQLQWPWISFPVILALSTTIFFVLVVESAANHKTPVWKLSPLAWILAGRDSQQTEKGDSASVNTTIVAMEEEAKKVCVHLFQRPTPHIGMFNGRHDHGT